MKTRYLSLALLLSIARTCSSLPSAITRACTIYCEGKILETVQLAQVYNDSKTFVDMPMKYDPELVSANFSKLTVYNQTTLLNFLNENFYAAGSDIESYVPIDFKNSPTFLNYITSPSIQSWAYDVNQLWLLLSKQVAPSVLQHPQRHSFTPYAYPMVVPGGRFRESYYWDSYWIVRGLMICEMNTTAWGEIGNLLQDVDTFGFVQNGGRIYYLDRSQPPLLSEMVSYYLDNVGWSSPTGLAKLQYALPLLEKEYNWWMDINNGHVVTVRGHTLNRYHSNGTTPRPESYYEDANTCQHGNVSTANNEPWASSCYNNIRSGAETGWDFSSRWLKAPYTNMSSIETGNIVPVDLNSILYTVELNLASMVSFLQDQGLPYIFNYSQYNASYFLDAAQNRYDAINAVLWENSASKWQDFNISANSFSSSEIVTIASWTPMWAGLLSNQEYHAVSRDMLPEDKLSLFKETVRSSAVSADADNSNRDPLRYRHRRRKSAPTAKTSSGNIVNDASTINIGNLSNYSPEAVYNSLMSSGLLQPGGILTTVLPTGQQWDSPNSWPPLVWLAIEGLLNLGLSEADSLASQISELWINTNYVAYVNNGYMYEKYNAFEPGVGGGGGEYTPQIGFGWTNGVALSLLTVMYPPFTPSSNSNKSNDLQPWQIALIVVFLVIFAAIAGVVFYWYVYARKASPNNAPLLEPKAGHNEVTMSQI